MLNYFNLFDQLWSPSRVQANYGDTATNVNTYKDGDDIVVTAEIPGIKKADINLEVKNDILRISGKRVNDFEKKGNPYRLERASGEFERSFKLPFVIDAEKVDATYVDGVLKVRLSQSESEKPKQIAIS